MTPSRPYLVRAIYEWLTDNDLTPHLLINAACPGVIVPGAYVKDGRIALNIAPGAVRDLFIHNDAVSFLARFGGVPMKITTPIQSVLAIYARENGQGMFFDENENFLDDGPDDDEPPKPEPPKPASPQRPVLRIVK